VLLARELLLLLLLLLKLLLLLELLLLLLLLLDVRIQMRRLCRRCSIWRDVVASIRGRGWFVELLLLVA